MYLKNHLSKVSRVLRILFLLTGFLLPIDSVACAAANAVIETLTEGNVLEEVPVLSEEMFKQLESLADRKSIVNEIRGRGLMIAVEFDKDIAADVVNECRELGLLLNNVRPNTVRFLPPLTITKEEIQQACQILEKSIEKVTV